MMKFRWFLLLIIMLIAIPYLSASDGDGWDEVTVGDVDFKIPEKFSNGEIDDDGICYKHGDPFDFLIFSLIKYKNLKSMYGSYVSSDDLMDIEETEIAGHHAVVIHSYNDMYDHDFLEVFFVTGEKIFRIHYDSDKVTDELREIIGSTPGSEMSKETFLNKLDDAQKEYAREDYEKNLELDLEDYYKKYNDHHRYSGYY